MALGGFSGTYLELVPSTSIDNPSEDTYRLWVNSNDGNIYAKDKTGSLIQMTDSGSLATGNAQYMWDYFTNSTDYVIPAYSAVRLISGGAKDGTIAFCDADIASEDSFLGIVYGGDIAVGEEGIVIYGGKVPNAVLGRSLNSNTCIYMSTIAGAYTNVVPDIATVSIFQIGFTRGNDLYLRPQLISDVGD